MESVYYISQGKTTTEHLNNIQAVCEAGCRLIQLRMKKISEVGYLTTAKKAKEICDEFGAQLFINDNVEVAKNCNATGVHLGKSDLLPSKARNFLNDNQLIGGTANTLEDCLNLIEQKVDYIGMGPFRFTITKKNLSPVLGLDGYSKIITELRKQGHQTPVYAIGGIEENDVAEIVNTGVAGIAISGFLTNKSKEELKRIIDNCNAVFEKIN